MDSSPTIIGGRGDSPDPSSRVVDIYDVANPEGEWIDEVNDDIDSEPSTYDSEDVDFFDLPGHTDPEFQGMM